MWVEMYSDDAPAQIHWSAEAPFQSREAADCPERIAQIAEALFAERQGTRKVANNRKIGRGVTATARCA